MPRLGVLLHFYLIVRIVICPCLSGENFHDTLSRSFYSLAGVPNWPSDELTDPRSSTDLGVCICEGALSPNSPDCPQANANGGTDPERLACFDLALISRVERSTPLLSRRPPPVMALKMRALLQNFRC